MQTADSGVRMTFSEAIDLFIADRRSQGRINSPRTEQAYRRVLGFHCDDVGDVHPAKVTRGDVKTTLRRWPHPNSQRQAHAVLASFYDWAIEEGMRETVSPARQVARAKARAVSVFRPTLAEVVALMDAATAAGRREKWVVHLGVLAGLRRQELRLLQGRHLARDGWVWVSPDIGKGGRQRWMPVTSELEPVVAEIRALVGDAEFVTPSRRTLDPPFHTRQADRPETPISGEGIYKMVQRVGRLAGLASDIGPHTLRHAYGDHVARYAGLKAAQALMGHASVQTTESAYTAGASLDELAVSVHGFTYRRSTPANINPQHSSDAR